MKRTRKHLNPPTVLVIGFGIIILIGSFLLSLPVASKNGHGIPWIDAFFTATSATCVTGLVVVDTGHSFSLFGQLVILFLIQVGGLGFITFATLFAILLGKRVSFQDRLLLQESLNNLSVDGIIKLVKRIIIFTIIIETVGGILLTIPFTYEYPTDRAIYYGFYHSISSFNNAGFDLMGSFRSFTNYAEHLYINLILCVLIFLGGIGFIVLNEVYEYHKTKRFSLHTKLVLMTSLILTVVGTVLIFCFEFNNPETLQPLSMADKIVSSLYQAISPRSAGSNTLSIPDLTQSTLFLLILLMFIGASPGSFGGGIKTSTFAVLVGAVWSQITGKSDVSFFKRRIPYRFIYRSLTIATIAILIIIIVTMLLTVTEQNSRVDFLTILFEATSAANITGLSMGLTPNLSFAGKVILSVTMFIGRIGPLTIAFAIANRRRNHLYRYPEGKVMIG
ncbi:trk system potassium uptake protein TrkH [Thermoactinomyces sp. DSM 45891]|uniref:TrkH family potassium uptake protein n=1 Tax=Thermoactinomyces sp. DSM 45891 TaxID=1761907 RepID=UPI00091277CD|nr:TrkH family potassium uptake protein [Thermoactinomyces sp. DSM 45891]SFX21159.1 trk system potassium uptake protein TrkH [Thermoactinomyces sp. DSM 45891]